MTEIIKSHMKQNKISKKQLHLESGVAYSNICEFLNNKADIRIGTLIKLLDTLDLDISLNKRIKPMENYIIN